jgi:cell shape-determining protein MreD
VVIGLARDLLSVERFGVGMLMYLITGLMVMLLRRLYFSELPLVRALAAFVLLCTMNWAWGGVLLLTRGGLDVGAWFRAGAAEALVTALVTPLLCRALGGLGLVRPYYEF